MDLATHSGQLKVQVPCTGCGTPFQRRERTRRYCSAECWYAHGVRTWRKPGLAPSERPTTRDLAWAAGIYEGEGTCCGPSPARSSARTGRLRRQFRVSVTQKDPWLCNRLRALFGGSVNFHKRPQPDRGGQAIYHWQLSGARARGFVFTVFSLLSPRRRGQIGKALAPQ